MRRLLDTCLGGREFHALKVSLWHCHALRTRRTHFPLGRRRLCPVTGGSGDKAVPSRGPPWALARLRESLQKRPMKVSQIHRRTVRHDLHAAARAPTQSKTPQQGHPSSP